MSRIDRRRLKSLRDFAPTKCRDGFNVLLDHALVRLYWLEIEECFDALDVIPEEEAHAMLFMWDKEEHPSFAKRRWVVETMRRYGY